jgi:SAM-dependent methyltransferase
LRSARDAGACTAAIFALQERPNCCYPVNNGNLDGVEMKLNELAKTMTLNDWVTFILSAADADVADGRSPGLPPADIQELTNNISGRKSLAGAASLYKLVFQEVRSRIGDSTEIKLLDFGCGWGRFARFFPQLTTDENIFGVDVDARLIAACEEYLATMNFALIKARQRIPFPDAKFDLVFSNSVFSHLNEEAQRFCIAEIGRCMKPGGLFIATTMGRRNLRALYKRQEGWLTGVLGSQDGAEDKLDRGEFVFGSTGRWQDYGLAFLPDDWARTNWSPAFDLIEVNTKLSQDVNIATRCVC